MAKGQPKNYFRTILSIITFIAVILVVYFNWSDISFTLEHLGESNWFILFLLIPEQLLMYYSCGKIFFSYLENSRGIKTASKAELLRISTELNFVNHAVPAGGFGGLAFLTYRLHPFDVTAGQTSFIYIFRFAITTIINYIQALLAVVLMLIFGMIPASAMWVVWVAVLMNVGVSTGLILIVLVASSKKRIDFFSKIIVKFVNSVVKFFTFGRKTSVLTYEKINHYLLDIHESVIIARRDKKLLIKPTLWGIIYSLFEVATYWIVAIAFGHPELLLVIMVSEAVGSVFDGIVPFGLYELGMFGVMVALGTNEGIALIVTIVTRAITLVLTIITGYYPYNKTLTSRNHERKS